MTGAPRLYGELAEWWPLLSDPADYEDEARIFAEAIEQTSERSVHTVLELGCGGGNNASHLEARYEMTLTDVSADMLAVSKKLNPGCEHLQGDMRTLRLGRVFDAVFVHDAVAYMTTEEDLEAAMRTAHEHLAPGGVALFVPDDTTECFRQSTSIGGHDGDGRALRYLQWEHPPRPGETSFEITFVYVLRQGDTERVETDKHLLGVFPRAVWLSLLEGVGFRTETLPFRHSSFAPDDERELFLGLRP